MTYAERYPYQGRMLTARQIADLTGIPISTVYRRGNRGRPVDVPLPQRTGRVFEYRGQMLTVKEIAVRAGKSEAWVYQHVSGTKILEQNPPEKALPYNAVLLTFNGIIDSVAGWARRTGIPKDTIYARTYLRGWTVSRILTEPPGPNPKRYSHAGQTLTLREWAACTGLPHAVLMDRMKRGMDIARALTLPVMDSQRKGIIRDNRRTITRMAASFRRLHRATSRPPCPDYPLHHPPGGYDQTLTGGRLTGGGRQLRDLQSLQHNNSDKGGRHADPHR